MCHTHICNCAGAEASASVKPIVALEFIDLDALAIGDLHRCHEVPGGMAHSPVSPARARDASGPQKRMI
jgi:hypothetical protein